MNIRQLKECWTLYNRELEINTKASRERAENMRYYLTTHATNSGAYGKIIELASHTEKSNKRNVATQNRADTFIKMRVSDKQTNYYAVEIKTNGGRIESLYKPNAPKFVVYSMDINNSLVNYKVNQKLFTRGCFLTMLEKIGAIKNTNGTNPERAIQCSSKKLYTLVSNYEIDYIPTKTYNLDFFDFDNALFETFKKSNIEY